MLVFKKKLPSFLEYISNPELVFENQLGFDYMQHGRYH